MRVGIQLPEIERRVGWDEVRSMAVLAEQAGFDSIWVGDHLLYDEGGVRTGPWEAWTQLAALAAVTDRVQLGPLVAALPFHQPAILAKMAATIDEISGGRLVLGVGAGWNEVEFKAFGIPLSQRVSRFAEQFEILRRLLSGERFDFDGRFYRLKDVELLPAPQAGGPPMMIGSNGSRMLSIALPHVAMWNSWYLDFENDPARLPDLVSRIDQACVRVGRDPDTLEKTVAVLVKFDDIARRRSPDNPIRGSASHVAEQLSRIEGSGISHVQLVLDPITTGSIERAAEVRSLL